jgi:hypothetical protein
LYFDNKLREILENGKKIWSYWSSYHYGIAEQLHEW